MEEHNDIAQMLALLHELQGIDFVRQLKLITERREFTPLTNNPLIYTVGGENDDDYAALLDAARKAVEHGNTVYLLPNPRNCRTADFIFEKKGAYKMYDLKTVHGNASVSSQLLDSIGQCNRVLLNMISDYNARLLASDIKKYFEANRDAIEVMIYKGKKALSVNRYSVQSPLFHKQFRKKYEK